nr:hypothetical protein [Tanacetum cinerariifolium]
MTNCGNLLNGACFGMGCSQAMIPYGLNTFRIRTFSNTDEVGKWGFNNCTYGFIVEKDRYNFTKSDIGTMRERTYPVVLEWWVRDNISCENAKTRYRCKCAQGYKGNAYLPNSCKDIDECAGKNECIYGCLNTKGGYNCSCPSGQQGDGWRNGRDAQMPHRLQAYHQMVVTVPRFDSRRNIIKSREMFFKKNGGLILQRLLFEAKQSNHMAKIFLARVLEKATDNFHKSNVIGEGGY